MRALLLLVLAVTLAAAPAAAAVGVGVLEFADGPVTVESTDSGRVVKSGAALAADEVVATGARATAIVRLDDGSLLKLKADSRLRLPSDAHAVVQEVLLYLGGVFAQITKRSPGAEFRVRTPGAVAAVRGTRFFTAFGRTHGKSRDLWVCVDQGAVEVGSTASKRRLLVPAGQGVLIKGERSLTKPQPYDWTKTLNWNMDPAKGAVVDKTDLDSAYTDLLDQDYR